VAETSVMDYQYWLRIYPEQRSSVLLHSESFKSCRCLSAVFGVSVYCSQPELAGTLQEEEEEEKEAEIIR